MTTLSNNYFYLALVFICLSLIILHPYTIYGKPGVLIAGVMAVYGLYHGVKKEFAKLFLIPVFILLMIGVIGVISSIFNDIFQLNHLLAVVSFLVMLCAAYGLWIYCQRRRISRDEVLATVLFVLVLNSVIIILELNFQSFRLLIESFLDPLSGGSINYATGFRLRGIASSGGAGLSVSIPVALTLALHLYSRKILSFYLFTPIIIILLFSVLVIGRTGLILSAIPFVTYMILMLKQSKVSVALLAKFVVFFLVLISLYPFVIRYFIDMFGEGFIEYAIGFLLAGSEGVEKEGTTRIVLDYLTVLPVEFPQALVGYGFYGGSNFVPWTDSGFSRMFLSVGFVFGLIFNMLIYRIYFLAFRGGNKYLIGTIILLLTIAEIKEPLLFSGVASRIFIIVLVFCWFEKCSLLKRNRMERGLLPCSNDC